MSTSFYKRQNGNGKVIQQKEESTGMHGRILEDNRPEAFAQQRFQETMRDTPDIADTTQLVSDNSTGTSPMRKTIQRKSNDTGLPDTLKSGIENLSGISMDDVKVHRNSSKPAQLNAHAYAQGTDIHLASGQEKHLPHEAWHVVQQKQGRVKPTMQMKGEVNVNDDEGLEKEADVMGAKAIQMKNKKQISTEHPSLSNILQRNTITSKVVVQRKTIAELDAVAQPRMGHAANLNAIRQHNATMIIGATHTGDMYHLKAAKAIFPELNVLIWGVNQVDNDPTLNSAFTIASYMNDRAQTYYTDHGKPGGHEPTNIQIQNVTHGTAIAWKRWVDEGKVTALIMNASVNSGDAGATERDLIRTGTAPIVGGPMGDALAFGVKLHHEGFRRGTNYVLVNFRESGHLGGAHPALDTGTGGFDEIIAQVRAQVPGAEIVPMGERLPAVGGPFTPNLINYWTWACCAGSREKQAGMLRYLNENFRIAGAIGMRSGIMDMLAFAGIPIISIDISPTKAGNTSSGWERGSKLERSLGVRYGRSFIEHQRAGEGGAGPGWVGNFNPADLATIGTSIGNYFTAGGAIPGDNKDPSHPLSTGNLDALITRLTGAAPNHGGPMVPPVMAIPAEDRRYMNRIRNLLALNYTQVPNSVSYQTIINHLLTYA